MEAEPQPPCTRAQQVQTAGAEARLTIPSLLVSTQEGGAPLGLLLLPRVAAILRSCLLASFPQLRTLLSSLGYFQDLLAASFSTAQSSSAS